MLRLFFASLIVPAVAFSTVSLADPITPKETIQLFNGNDLTNFYTWLGPPGKDQPPLGKNNDPEKVFTVHDGMIHVSGKIFGAFITEKEFENYHLVAEFRWGTQTYPPREKKAMDSGILLHCVGEDGAAGGVWMESIECQIIEGGTCDFILVGGKNTPGLTVEHEHRSTFSKGGKESKQPYYKPGAPTKEFKGGRINWYARDPHWEDVVGFRGKHDVEKPVGEWNTLECVCAGDTITNILNGQVVNKGTKSSHTK